MAVCWLLGLCVFFFFQAEDGIRDKLVTGVQTCALPICERLEAAKHVSKPLVAAAVRRPVHDLEQLVRNEMHLVLREVRRELGDVKERSEEHTSELQSLAYLVCRLLLEKKNIQQSIWM